MKIYVCIKHVPDSAATIAFQGPTEIDETVTFLLNPYDENALEAAMGIKANTADSEVVALTLGKADAVNTLRSALAMGADRGIHVLTDRHHDSLVTARALTAAMARDGLGDLVLTGKVAIDSEGSQTMFRLGAALDWPVMTQVTALNLGNGEVTAECEWEAGGRHTLKAPLPCVIGTTKALNQPRYPTLPDIMKARKKEVTTVKMETLEMDLPAGAMELLELKPAVESRRGKVLKGTPQEAVTELVRLLREEAKVI